MPPPLAWVRLSGPKAASPLGRLAFGCILLGFPLVMRLAQPLERGDVVGVAAHARTGAHVVRLGALGRAAVAIAIVVLTLWYT